MAPGRGDDRPAEADYRVVDADLFDAFNLATSLLPTFNAERFDVSLTTIPHADAIFIATDGGGSAQWLDDGIGAPEP